MKVVMLMFDSLNRHMLPGYGCDWTHAPNFKRLAGRSARFDKSYVCSMPCMPARRDLHTARPNFLHTGWGPIEPFDDSIFEMLQSKGIYTHLSTDHYHYVEDGGATYHTRYNTWEVFRGQEGDPWIGQVADPPIPEHINKKERRQDWVNRQHVVEEHQYSQHQTVQAGLDFIDRNASQDNWVLQIECFDPHEPFVSPDQYKELYDFDYSGPLFDWPGYRAVDETPEQVEHAKMRYAALLSMCDASLGRVLDAMDRHDLWDDTMLIVWTDHGFMLGEHGCWAKSWRPLYQEVAHTPFFIWDPRCRVRGESRQSLVQPSIDLGPTILGLFDIPPTGSMLGKDLAGAIASDQSVRNAAIFGYHGSWTNVTDGRHVYLRDVVIEGNLPLYSYTLMPTRMRGFKPLEQIRTATLHPPFSFTKGCPVLKIGKTADEIRKKPPVEHLLFDVQEDPTQQHPLKDAAIEQRMIKHMVRLMQQCEAPPEQYVRMGLEHGR